MKSMFVDTFSKWSQNKVHVYPSNNQMYNNVNQRI